jgi:hypothetical protein
VAWDAVHRIVRRGDGPIRDLWTTARAPPEGQSLLLAVSLFEGVLLVEGVVDVDDEPLDVASLDDAPPDEPPDVLPDEPPDEPPDA